MQDKELIVYRSFPGSGDEPLKLLFSKPVYRILPQIKV